MATVNRVNGLVSNFDTETLVKDLMKMETAKTNKVLREKEYATWQKDAYREVMSLFRGFQSEYLDVLKPTSNLRSTASFSAYTASARIGGVDTTKAAATTSSNSVSGTITIDSITKLATRDTWVSSSDVKPLEGIAANLANVNAGLADKNTISVTLDGVTKNINLSGGATPADGYDNLAELVSDLNSQMTAAFGAGKATVTETDGKIKFGTTGHTITLKSGEEDLLTNLGFTAGASNALSLTTKLSDVFPGLTTETMAFSINGVSSTKMGITADDTVQSMIKKVNASGAGVTLSYNSLTNGFTMKSIKEGFANSIELTDDQGFFNSKLKLSTAAGRTIGEDSVFSVNGLATTRSENSIVVDGTTVHLKETSASAISISVSADKTKVKDNIVKFVTKYNELIEKVQGRLSEERYRDYTPLVDEEKADMSDDNIKLWESKAKSGIIRSDGILTDLMSKLRRAFGESVEGVGITLQEMGITTSSNYKDKGMLVIDETKLDTALSTKMTEVTEFFTKESSALYGDASNVSKRYSENGLAARVNDILNDSIRITRDSNGKKGLLVEKAGYEKSSSDTTSDLAKKITTLENRYSVLLEKMNDAEDRYYAKFTAMETALSKMNSQSTSLASMLGSSS